MLTREKPYLSLVVAARNDNHGGNMLARMQAFLDAWLGQTARYDLPSELIVVEWNPPPNRPRLMEALQWTYAGRSCGVRFVEVSLDLHRRFRNADAIPLHQMIAKNAGIRRARGEFVLASNLDIVFSPELMRFLVERRLEPRTLYRIDRYDVAGDIPSPASLDQLIQHCQRRALRVFSAEGGFALEGPGRRALDTNDIVAHDSGIRFGAGCFPVDSDGYRFFRWLDTDAEILIDRPLNVPPRLVMDAEAGPSAGQSPVIIQILDGRGGLLASASVEGCCQLRLHLPDQISSATLRLRIQSNDLPLERDSRFLSLRLFRLRWDDETTVPGAARWHPGSLQESGVRVRSLQSRQVQLELKPGPGSRLASLRANLSDATGSKLFEMNADQLQLSPAEEYLLTLDLGFELSNTAATAAECESGVDPAWNLEVIGMKPGRDWSREFESPSPSAAHMHNPAHLHTNGCGDFTLLSRQDWFALRGYAEFPIWPMHVDSLLCYAAHHAGIREVVLRDPLRIFHIEHLSGAGWTPEGEEALNARIQSKGVRKLHNDEFVKWVDQMRRLNAPVIFTQQNWGLADVELPERVLDLP